MTHIAPPSKARILQPKPVPLTLVQPLILLVPQLLSIGLLAKGQLNTGLRIRLMMERQQVVTRLLAYLPTLPALVPALSIP